MDIGLMLLVLTVINCFVYFLFYRGTPMRLFGYRSKQAIANPENWNFAQVLFCLLAFLLLSAVITLQRTGIINQNVYTLLSFAAYILSAIIVEIVLYVRK